MAMCMICEESKKPREGTHSVLLLRYPAGSVKLELKPLATNNIICMDCERSIKDMIAKRDKNPFWKPNILDGKKKAQ